MKIVTLHIGHDFPGGTHYLPTVENAVARELTRGDFPGFTLMPGTGYWEGEAETCTVVTLVVQEASIERLRAITSNLAGELEQDCIMFTVQDCEVAFVSED